MLFYLVTILRLTIGTQYICQLVFFSDIVAESFTDIDERIFKRGKGAPFDFIGWVIIRGKNVTGFAMIKKFKDPSQKEKPAGPCTISLLYGSFHFDNYGSNFVRLSCSLYEYVRTVKGAKKCIRSVLFAGAKVIYK